jgi:hypothetical protein
MADHEHYVVVVAVLNPDFFVITTGSSEACREAPWVGHAAISVAPFQLTGREPPRRRQPGRRRKPAHWGRKSGSGGARREPSVLGRAIGRRSLPTRPLDRQAQIAGSAGPGELRRSGSVTRTFVPATGWESIATEPWWAATMAATIERPSPEPEAAREGSACQKRSKAWATPSALMPGPVSDTTIICFTPANAKNSHPETLGHFHIDPFCCFQIKRAVPPSCSSGARRLLPRARIVG